MSRSGDETAVTEEAPPKESLPNLFSLFPKINFQLPFLPPKPQEPNPEAQGPKPSCVHQPLCHEGSYQQFPKTQVAVVVSSPLQAEPDADHSPAAKTTNPLILWQDLKVFVTFNEELFNEITQLLTLENFRENEQLSKYGDTKSARAIEL
ncbi:Protein TOPLESS, partial [Glycine soja]